MLILRAGGFLEVSVIVPVRNGADGIRQCLASVLGVRFPRDRFEVICVDNDSTDGTAAILREFGDSVRVLHEKKRGAAAARNAGLRVASGEWVAFTDADGSVDAGWLEHLLPPLRHGVADGVGGRILARQGAGVIERFGETIHDHRRAIEESWPPYLASGNMALPSALLRQHGGFDERWLRCQDSELSFRLVSAGRRFAYAPGAIVHHNNRANLADLCKEAYKHGYWGAELYRVYAELDAREPVPAASRGTVEEAQHRLQPWQHSALSNLFRAAKRVGWAIGKRFPPEGLR